MGKKDKLVDRLLLRPKDFTWGELVTVLGYLGYHEYKGGKTGGSRRKFIDEENNIISLHKPHPSNVLKAYAINDVINHLISTGKLKDHE